MGWLNSLGSRSSSNHSKLHSNLIQNGDGCVFFIVGAFVNKRSKLYYRVVNIDSRKVYRVQESSLRREYRFIKRKS